MNRVSFNNSIINFFYNHRIIQKILFLTIVIICIFIFYNTLLTVLYPLNLGYGEGIILYQVEDLIVGKFDLNTIYPDFKILPYNVNPYTPIYILLVGFINHIFNLSAVLVGRLLSFVSFLLTGLVIFKISSLFFGNKNKFLSLSISFIFLSSFLIFFKFSIVHVDMLGFLFYLSGIFFFFQYFFKQKDIFLYLSAILLVIAFYTKQTYLIFPISVILYLFFSKNKDFFKFFLLFSGLSALLFFWINLITHGNFFLHVVFQNTLHQISLYKIFRNWTVFFVEQRGLIFIFFIIILNCSFYYFFMKDFYSRFSKITKKFVSFMLIYVPSGCIFTLLATSKVGASINHFFEVMFINILLLIISFTLVLEHKKVKSKLLFVFKIQKIIIENSLLLICLFVFLENFYYMRDLNFYLYNNLPSELVLINEINRGDYYYSDVPVFLTHTKSLPTTIDPFIFTQLYRNNWLGFSDIEKLVKNGKLKKIILSESLDNNFKKSFYNGEMKYLFDQYYIFKRNIAGKFIYELK